MLNFNLQQLCGPKCNDLKVRNPAKYGWEPRRLLGQIFDIYVHLDWDRFATALAADERSFEKHLLDNAAARIERLGMYVPIFERLILYMLSITNYLSPLSLRDEARIADLGEESGSSANDSGFSLNPFFKSKTRSGNENPEKSPSNAAEINLKNSESKLGSPTTQEEIIIQ